MISYKLSQNEAAIYVRKPLHSGQIRIDILLKNLLQHPTDPISFDFDNIVICWYRDLLLDGNYSTNATVVKNYIFAAFGLYSSTHIHNA